MKKRKTMVIVIAIALAIACTHHSIQKLKNKKAPAQKVAALPYLPSALIDVSFFPGNVYQFLVNYL